MLQELGLLQQGQGLLLEYVEEVVGGGVGGFGGGGRGRKVGQV